MNTTTAEASDDGIVRHSDFHHMIKVDACLHHGLGLGYGAGKAVKQETPGTIRLLDTLLYQPDDDIVGHQPARIHHRFGLPAQFSLRLDRRTQHIAGGDLGNTIFLGDELGLGALPGAGSAQQN